MVEALKNDSTRPRTSTASPPAVSKKNDPDQPKGALRVDDAGGISLENSVALTLYGNGNFGGCKDIYI